MNVCVFDPALMDRCAGVSPHLGDVIIQEAIGKEIRSLFGKVTPTSVSSHEWLAKAWSQLPPVSAAFGEACWQAAQSLRHD
jgi:hypothetical protein